MNILYIAFSCNPFAGSEDKIGWCVPSETSNNNKVYVITKEEQREPVERYLQSHPLKNIEFYYVDIPNFYKRIFKGFMYSGRLIVWNKRVLPLAKEICVDKKIDIIHQITPVEFRAIGDYGKIANVKFVCGPLGGGESLPQGLKDYAKGHRIIEIVRSIINRWYRFKLKNTGKLEQCDYIMFANKETKEYLVGAYLNCPYEPVTEVAVDINDIKNTCNEKSKNEECVFLVAGRMIYRKGLDFLFDALMRIPQETRYQVRVVGDGPELEHLRKRCKDNSNLSEHVRCMGSIPYMEMEKEYLRADVFIMPSIRETTGTVLLEAMSNGIPVITINKFGGAALFDENTGWLYDGNSKEEYIENLKKAILECITNPDEVERRGMNAQKKAESYTWQEKNRKYQKIYDDLLKV